jgi:hypothetical protein
MTGSSPSRGRIAGESAATSSAARCLIIGEDPVLPCHAHTIPASSDADTDRFDASGNIVEHYSDGDLVNKHTKVTREAASPQSLFVWGPNVPLGFLTGKVEDAGKPMPVPPLHATPAVVSAGSIEVAA